MKRIFRHYGVTARLIDITTHQDLWNKMSRSSLEHERALEVVKWAKDNKITNWIAIDPNDPNIPTTGLSQGGFDANLGLMFYQKDKFYAGVSATHLPATSLADLGFTTARHIYVMGGYNHDLNNGLVIRTNALIKSDMKASPAIDVNANVLWNNLLWGGVAFRPGDAIIPMAGLQMTLNTVQQGRYTYTHGFKMGYSYDVTLSTIKDYSAGSHEFFLTYEFNLGKTPIRRISGDPRLL
jgi:type IX secretion system PorP/SprF family membrane protein